ncbi:hypothetical protein AZE42_11993, partial [Rhizopogon vesiculosus]
MFLARKARRRQSVC